MGNKLKILYIGNKLAAFGNTPTGIDTLGPLLAQEGYDVVYGGERRNKVLRLLNMLSVIIKYRKTADVVLIDTYSTTAFYFAWLSAWMCKRVRVKYIPILRGGNMPERLKQSENMCRMLLGDSYANLVLSAYLKKHVEAAGYDTLLIENNVILKHYPFKVREELFPKLLWVRSFDEIYNPLMAIKVLEELNKQYPDARLTMVGPDKDGSMIQCIETAQQKNLNVAFTDKLSKAEWIRLSEEADIFINTTNYDNVPISVLEAMALGLPVVSTNVGGLPYLIQDGENGLLVEKNDVEGMSRVIVSLLKDIDKAKEISSNARHFVEQYDWQVVKQKWNKLFLSLNG